MPIVFDFEREKLLDKAKELNCHLEFKEVGRLGGHVVYRMIVRGFCPFFSLSDRSCRIHEVKPLSCKMYPLLLDVRDMKVMLSLLCEWVRRYKINQLSVGEVLDMFKEEIAYLLQVVKLIQGE